MKNAYWTVGRLGLIAVCLALVMAAGAAHADVAIQVTAYVSNTDSATISVIDIETMTEVVAPISVGGEPRGSVVSPSGDRVYVVSRSADEVYAINTGTHEIDATIAVSGTDAYNCAITPDGTRLYVVCKWSNTVVVIDTQKDAEIASIDLSAVSDASPEGLVVAPDGKKVYIVSRQDESVFVISTATNTITAGPIAVGSAPRAAAVTPDSSKVIVVGEDGPVILRTSDDTDTNAGLAHLGSQRDVAIAGNTAYVTNFFNSNVSGPAIDIYDMVSETYVESIPLTGFKAYGIAVSPDGSRAWVTLQDSNTLVTVDLLKKTVLGTADVGSSPRGVSVVIQEEETQVASFFLPKKVKLKIAGPGKDKLVSAGFFDDGGETVDYTQPVTLRVGGFEETFLLTSNNSGTAYKHKGYRVKMKIRPNLKGSSRGKFRLKIGKTTLQGKIDPEADLEIHFTAAGLSDASGTVTLTRGFYGLGQNRGALLSPGFFPSKMKVVTSDTKPDKVLLKGGSATNGITPSSLDHVVVALGDTFSRTILGSQFTKKGDVFKFAIREGGVKLTVVLNYARETITLKSKGIEVGDLTTSTADVLVDAGPGIPPVRTMIRLGASGSKRFY